VLRTGLKIDGEAPRVDTPPPLLGQHTEALLAELGHGPEEIEQLREQGVL
jgi:crotonobetainyl-CoA:carnitine CoA-transferase CaiB-like acyl-CoA transferase